MESTKIEKDNPAMTDRNLRISGPLLEVLSHDQSSNRPFQNDAEKRAKERATVSILHFALFTVHLDAFSKYPNHKKNQRAWVRELSAGSGCNK